MRITLFIPCFVDQFFPQVGIAMVEVLERLGHDVAYPERQTCCGQPAYNAGFQDESRCVARHFLRCFEGAETIVAPSGSCVAMVKNHYAHLFSGAGDANAGTAAEVADRIWEFSEFLVDRLATTDVESKFSGRATYHDGCHSLRELGIRDAPRELLRQVSGLELVEFEEGPSCCGFGGTFSVKFPDISTAMAQTKCAAIERTGAQYVISGDPSCLMQIQGYMQKQGKDIQCLHVAEVLACR